MAMEVTSVTTTCIPVADRMPEAMTIVAIAHQIDLGHCRIELIGINDDADVTTGSMVPPSRVSGYQQSLLAAGIAVEDELQQFDVYSVSGGAAAMTGLLSAPARPTAVFAASDEMAFGALDVVRSAGRDVPGDVSIVGFDNHDLSGVMGLSTIDQNVRGRVEQQLNCCSTHCTPTHRSELPGRPE